MTIDNELDDTSGTTPDTSAPATEQQPAPQPQQLLSRADLELLRDLGVDEDADELEGDGDEDTEADDSDDLSEDEEAEEGDKADAGDEEPTRQSERERQRDTPDSAEGYEIAAAISLPETEANSALVDGFKQTLNQLGLSNSEGDRKSTRLNSS